MSAPRISPIGANQHQTVKIIGVSLCDIDHTCGNVGLLSKLVDDYAQEMRGKSVQNWTSCERDRPSVALSKMEKWRPNKSEGSPPSK
jgi:hypothetical protein